VYLRGAEREDEEPGADAASFLVALRREAGVMLGELSDSEPGSDSRSGAKSFTGVFGPLPLDSEEMRLMGEARVFTSVTRFATAGLEMALGARRWKLNVVLRDIL
jgi:hypothetical protein